MRGLQIPHWLALPILALSTLTAAAGALLMLYAAANGEYTPALLSVAVFAGAALLWYAADVAGHQRP
jgi:hypothetical protein